MEEGNGDREERLAAAAATAGEARLQAVKGEAEQEAIRAFKEDQDMSGYTGKVL